MMSRPASTEPKRRSKSTRTVSCPEVLARVVGQVDRQGRAADPSRGAGDGDHLRAVGSLRRAFLAVPEQPSDRCRAARDRLDVSVKNSRAPARITRRISELSRTRLTGKISVPWPCWPIVSIRPHRLLGVGVETHDDQVRRDLSTRRPRSCNRRRCPPAKRFGRWQGAAATPAACLPRVHQDDLNEIPHGVRSIASETDGLGSAKPCVGIRARADGVEGLQRR